MWHSHATAHHSCAMNLPVALTELKDRLVYIILVEPLKWSQRTQTFSDIHSNNWCSQVDHRDKQIEDIIGKCPERSSVTCSRSYSTSVTYLTSLKQHLFCQRTNLSYELLSAKKQCPVKKEIDPSHDHACLQSMVADDHSTLKYMLENLNSLLQTRCWTSFSYWSLPIL